MPLHIGSPQAARRVSDFVVRAMQNPTLLHPHGGAFLAALREWQMMARETPGASGMSANRFGQLLLEKGALGTPERMMFVSKWRQAMTSALPAVQKTQALPAVQAQALPAVQRLASVAKGSPGNLANVQNDFQRYNRTMVLMINLLQTQHELQRAIVRNLRA